MPMYDHIIPSQADLIRQTPLFFVASALPGLEPGADGKGAVNVSPKGGVPLHLLDDHTVAYLDYPGSGNETARHILAGSPLTIMVMSLAAADAAIVRLYGQGTVTPLADVPADHPALAAPAAHLVKPRQVITLHVTATQTSCGYGVPVYEYVDQRSKAGRGRRYKAPRPHDQSS